MGAKKARRKFVAISNNEVVDALTLWKDVKSDSPLHKTKTSLFFFFLPPFKMPPLHKHEITGWRAGAIWRLFVILMLCCGTWAPLPPLLEHARRMRD